MRRRQWHPTPVLLPGKSHGQRSLVGCSPWGRWGRTWLSDFIFTFHFHALDKEMATHSSVFAWRIPGMGEPGGLPSMGSHRVGHDWSDLAAAAVFYFTYHQVVMSPSGGTFLKSSVSQILISFITFYSLFLIGRDVIFSLASWKKELNMLISALPSLLSQ